LQPDCHDTCGKSNGAIFVRYLFHEERTLSELTNENPFQPCSHPIPTLFPTLPTKQTSVGHSHPTVLKAAHEQLDKIIHTTVIYLNNQIAEYAKELTDRLPEKLSHVYFVNSGSEANDLALLMARAHTKKSQVFGLRNGYHGMSAGTMGLTALSSWRQQVPQGSSIHHVLMPDMYRGPFANLSEEDQGNMYAADVRNALETVGGHTAGFILESIQGVGGTYTYPKNYVKQAFESVREVGGVCISDEVQTGFGRTGTHFWGFENHDVVPDIVTMAKGMGNGAALGAVVTTEEIAQSIKGLHFNTYGGNPLSCAIGRAVLKVIDEDNIQQNALERGNQFFDGLRDLQKKYEIIGDLRGRGLMIGIDLVTDREKKTPASKEAAEILEFARQKGVLIGKGGLKGNVFRLKPVMCLNEQDVDYTLNVLDQAFEKISR